jgi:hypothetical protein
MAACRSFQPAPSHAFHYPRAPHPRLVLDLARLGEVVSRLCTGVLHSYCLLPRCLLLNLSLCLLVHLDLLHLNQANGAVRWRFRACGDLHQDRSISLPHKGGSATGGDRLTDDLRDVPRLSTAVAEFLIPRNKRMAGVGGDQTRLSVMTLMRAATGQGRSTRHRPSRRFYILKLDWPAEPQLQQIIRCRHSPYQGRLLLPGSRVVGGRPLGPREALVPASRWLARNASHWAVFLSDVARFEARPTREGKPDGKEFF